MKIIRKHRGLMSVHNTDGKGAEAIIVLPINQPNAL
jgi:signal transduction histidine kinase